MKKCYAQIAYEHTWIFIGLGLINSNFRWCVGVMEGDHDTSIGTLLYCIWNGIAKCRETRQRSFADSIRILFIVQKSTQVTKLCSSVARCNESFNHDKPCQCNSACGSHHDCCDDYDQVCSGGAGLTQTKYPPFIIIFCIFGFIFCLNLIFIHSSY